MAEIVLKDANVYFNSVDLSDHVRSVTLTLTPDIHDKTAMGSTFRKKVAGLKDWSVSVEYNQDYAASKVDATHFSLVGGTTYKIQVWADSTTAGAGNVQYSGPVLIESYIPVGGAVGELETVTVPYTGAGTLTRTT